MRRCVSHSPPTRQELEAKAAAWLTNPYGPAWGEWWYAVFEKEVFLESSLGGAVDIENWNFHVINGAIGYVACTKKISGQVFATLCDADFNPLPVRKADLPDPDYRKPQSAKELSDAALSIGSQFNYARVDLYSIPEGIFLGEITMCPTNASIGFSDIRFDEKLGDLWKVLS